MPTWFALLSSATSEAAEGREQPYARFLIALLLARLPWRGSDDPVPDWSILVDRLDSRRLGEE